MYDDGRFVLYIYLVSINATQDFILQWLKFYNINYSSTYTARLLNYYLFSTLMLLRVSRLK